jgi:hypothetical protein
MAKKIVNGTCLYCEEHKELKRSHSINRTFFNELLKSCGETNAARVISLSSDLIRNSNDNWTDHLLCADCESYFNEHFDGYGANALRGKISGQIIHKIKDKVIYQNTDTTVILLYILSLYWRGAKSKHPSYKALLTKDSLHYYYKNALKERKWNVEHVHVKISVLYDGLGLFTDDGLRQLMVSPFSRLCAHTKGFSFYFLIEGFFIEIFFGKMPYTKLKKGGWIAPNMKYLKCDMLDFRKIEEVQRVLMHGLEVKRKMDIRGISLK